MFDLISYHWEKLIPYADDDVPKARYFHSADACKFYSQFCFFS